MYFLIFVNKSQKAETKFFTYFSTYILFTCHIIIVLLSALGADAIFAVSCFFVVVNFTIKTNFNSISDIRLDTHLGNQSTSSNNSSNFGSRGALAWTPPASMGESTPTWTEGTPSFTESSSSENGK